MKLLRLLPVLFALAVYDVQANELDDVFKEMATLDGLVEKMDIPESECLRYDVESGSVLLFDDASMAAVDSLAAKVKAERFVDVVDSDATVKGWFLMGDDDDVTVLLTVVNDDNNIVILAYGEKRLLDGMQTP